MPEPTLQFLGEQIARIQSELRDLRSVRSDVAHLRADITDSVEALHRRIDGLEQSMAVQINQLQQTAATNLAILLEAIKGSSRL